MGSRPALDRHELAGVDELRELAVSLFRLQAQKLLDIAPLDCPALLVRKLHYEFWVSDLVDVGLAHEVGVLAGTQVYPTAEHVGAAAGAFFSSTGVRAEKTSGEVDGALRKWTFGSSKLQDQR